MQENNLGHGIGGAQVSVEGAIIIVAYVKNCNSGQDGLAYQYASGKTEKNIYNAITNGM